MENEFLKNLSEISDDDLIDRLMNFGIHEAIFSCENEECEDRENCKIAKKEIEPSIEYSNDEDVENNCPRSKELSEKLDAILYQVRLRLFIARLCFGHLDAIRSEKGDFNPIDKNGMISYKQQIINVKDSVEVITDLISDLAEYKLSLDDVSDLVENGKKTDPDGNKEEN